MIKINNQSKGFTLIEIIVVLIIVGILAAIALPNLFSNVAKSKADEGLKNLAGYKTLAEGCIYAQTPNNQASCAAKVIFKSTNLFDYSFSSAPNSTLAIKDVAYTLQATGKASGGLTVNDYITLRRDTTDPITPAFICVGYGVLAKAC